MIVEEIRKDKNGTEWLHLTDGGRHVSSYDLSKMTKEEAEKAFQELCEQPGEYFSL